MDRERLKDVKAADLTESTVNEDFVDWLKTKGMNWLLAILVVLVIYLGYVKYTQGQLDSRREAWGALADAYDSGLPASFESVADDYAGVDAVAIQARLQAATRRLAAVQRGVDIGETPADQIPLTDENRAAYLDYAADNFQAVLNDVAEMEQVAAVLPRIKAINGLACVAEARGNYDEARSFYQQAVDAAETHWPSLAAQAQARIDSLGDLSAVTLPTREEARSGRTAERLDQATVDPSLTELLLPDDES